MKNIISNIFKNKYFLATLGFIFLCYYIWFRFIRKVLPREIPFKLSLFNSIMLIIICFCYIYVIFRYVRPKNYNSILVTKFYELIHKFLFIFISLDELIKENNKINNKWENILSLIINKLNSLTIYDTRKYKYILYILIPKIVLVTIFILDVFFFFKLNFIYKCLIITLIPLTTYYFIYSIRNIKQKYFIILQDYLIEIKSEDEDEANYFMDPSMISYDNVTDSANDAKYKYLTIEHFVKLQTNALVCDDTPYRYICLHKNERKDLIILSQINIIKTNIKYYIEMLINVSVILESFEDIQKEQLIKKINMGIFILYLIGWNYILFTSLQSFHLTPLEVEFLKNFQDYFEPFSTDKII